MAARVMHFSSAFVLLESNHSFYSVFIHFSKAISERNWYHSQWPVMWSSQSYTLQQTLCLTHGLKVVSALLKHIGITIIISRSSHCINKQQICFIGLLLVHSTLCAEPTGFSTTRLSNSLMDHTGIGIQYRLSC